jgi:hypothetical protein
VLVGVPTVPVGPPPLIVTPGVPVLTKNAEGYVSVIVPPMATDPPAVVVNENVAEAPVLPATRSDVAISNVVLVTLPPSAIAMNKVSPMQASNILYDIDMFSFCVDRKRFVDARNS